MVSMLFNGKMVTEQEVEKVLSDHLNEGLESINAEGSFKVVSTDLIHMKFTVEFDIITVEEDKYLGLAGY